jgi:hypothetical protein
MQFSDTFGFSSYTYRTELQHYYSGFDLINEYRRMTILNQIRATGIGSSIALIPLTFGLSLVSAVYSGSQLRITYCKRDITVEEVVRCGLEVPIECKRDLCAGTTVGLSKAVTRLATHGLMDGLTG